MKHGKRKSAPKPSAVIKPYEVIRLKFADEYRRKFKPQVVLRWEALTMLALFPEGVKARGWADILHDAYAQAPDETLRFMVWMRQRMRKDTRILPALLWLCDPQKAIDLRVKLKRDSEAKLTEKEIAKDAGTTVPDLQNAKNWFRGYIKKAHPSLMLSMGDFL